MATRRGISSGLAGLPAELRKAVEAVFVRPTSGKITLVMSKCFNVLIARAIEMRQTENSGAISFAVPLSELCGDVEVDAKNTAFVKQTLRQLNRTSVEWDYLNEEGRAVWGVTTLLAEAQISDGMVTYSFAPGMTERLLSPKVYARISLSIQNKFRSRFALRLWEVCVRYVNNPTQLTARASWREWRTLLCDPAGEEGEYYAEYRRFNEKVLKRAVTEVNAVSEIEVEPIVFKVGKTVSELQFRIRRKPQVNLELTEGNLINKELARKIVSFGVPDIEAHELLVKFDEATLQIAIDATLKRLANTKDPLTAPAAYFRSTLNNQRSRGRKKVSAASPPSPPKSELTKVADAAEQKALRPALGVEKMASTVEFHLNRFRELAKSEQEVLFEAFLRTKTTRLQTVEAVLKSKIARSHFAVFLADRLG